MTETPILVEALRMSRSVIVPDLPCSKQTLASLEEIRLILTDVDQTLYPRSLARDQEIHRRLIHEIATRCNCHTEQATLAWNTTYIDSGSKALVEIMGIGADEAKAIVRGTVAQVPVQQFIEPNPGLAQNLQWIADKGIALGVISSSAEETIYEILARLSITPDIFSYVIDGTKPKSSGDAYRYLINSGVNPETTLMIGDRRDNDVLIPQRLGFHTIWVTDTKKGDQRFDTLQTPNVYGLFRLLAT